MNYQVYLIFDKTDTLCYREKVYYKESNAKIRLGQLNTVYSWSKDQSPPGYYIKPYILMEDTSNE